tara:strand:- start:491 stop:766 length:276 start_codon:yes stop_codon:yes gene_type:complete
VFAQEFFFVAGKTPKFQNSGSSKSPIKRQLQLRDTGVILDQNLKINGKIILKIHHALKVIVEIVFTINNHIINLKSSFLPLLKQFKLFFFG